MTRADSHPLALGDGIVRRPPPASTAGGSAAPLVLAGLAILLALPVPAARAQPWAGTAGIGVEVRGGGGPVPDARVELSWLGGRELSGPGAVLTDASGRVELGDLAAGPWLLRVRHPEFMGYDAHLEVEAGKKPRESRASVVKLGESTAGLQVRYFRVQGSPQAARPAPPLPATTSRAPADRAPDARRSPASPSESGAQDDLADTPPSRPLPEPETARLISGADETPPQPAVSRNVRSARGGGCFDCRPGEWATHVSGEPRPPGGPACPGDLAELAAGIADALVAERGPELDRYAGPLLPLEEAFPTARRTLTSLATPFDVGCQIVAVKLPRGARLGGLQMELATSREAVPCLPDGQCPGRTGHFEVVPRIEHTDFGTLVVAAFEHEADSREVPRLTVYFQPPGDWAP